MTNYTTEELAEIARQLRKPSGETGIIVGQMMNEGNRAMNLHSIAVLDPQPGDSILEIGMGNGYFIKNIVNLDTSINYCGIDHSLEMVEEASRINAKWVANERVKFIHHQGKAFPLANSQFNKVFTVNTFYFWDDPEKMLAEIKRVLVPEGLLILSLRPRHIMEQYPFTKNGFMVLDLDEIKQMLNSNGFSIKNITKVVEPDHQFDELPEKRESIILVGQI